MINFRRLLFSFIGLSLIILSTSCDEESAPTGGGSGSTSGIVGSWSMSSQGYYQSDCIIDPTDPLAAFTAANLINEVADVECNGADINEDGAITTTCAGDEIGTWTETDLTAELGLYSFDVYVLGGVGGGLLLSDGNLLVGVLQEDNTCLASIFNPSPVDCDACSEDSDPIVGEWKMISQAAFDETCTTEIEGAEFGDVSCNGTIFNEDGTMQDPCTQDSEGTWEATEGGYNINHNDPNLGMMFGYFNDDGQLVAQSSFVSDDGNFCIESTFDMGSIDCDACAVGGCTDDSACNYDPEATEDDGSCWYVGVDNEYCDCNMNINDCAGECGGSAVEDCAGECSGSAVVDCDGICGGLSLLDDCGACWSPYCYDMVTHIPDYQTTEEACIAEGNMWIGPGGANGMDPTWNADQDCAGECGGSAVEDCAGECGGSAAVDCAGVCGGTALVDECGVCEGDNSSCGLSFSITDVDYNNLELSVSFPSELVSMTIELGSTCQNVDWGSASSGAVLDGTDALLQLGTNGILTVISPSGLASGDGVLANLEIGFDCPTATFSIVSAVVGTSQGDVLPVLNLTGLDYISPCGDVQPDCTGQCGDAVVDCAGVCEGTAQDLGCGCGEPAAEQNFDCDGNCLVQVDCAGVCGGSAFIGCTGECDSSVVDECGDCNGGVTDSNDCPYFNVSIDETGESQLVIFQDSITSLEIGDEIGLFDSAGIIDDQGATGEILVGTAVWSGAQLNVVSIGSIDYSQFNGPILPGYVEGNSVVIKIYRDGVEYNASATFSAGEGLWGDIFIAISEIELDITSR